MPLKVSQAFRLVQEINSQEGEYVLVPISKLLALKNAVEEYAKEHNAMKKDLERLRKIKLQEG